MYVSSFIENLRNGVSKGLPGEYEHKTMLPNQRTLEPPYGTTPTISAVLILIDFDNNTPQLTFIERAKYNGWHSGQIGFPGGKVDTKLDKTLRDTAIRETFEEIGHKIAEQQIVAELSKLYISVSNIIIYPFVAVIDKLKNLKPNINEVENIFSVPLNQFTQENIEIGVFKGMCYQVTAPYWNVAGKRIWGATAMIVAELVKVISQGQTKI